MADMKLADLTAGTADGTDIVYAVKDPSGTPLDRKLTLSTVKDYITGAANLFTTAQTISPLTDVQGLTVRGGPAGTVNILQLQDSANNLLAAFDKDGLLTLGRGSGLTGQLKFSNSTNNNLVTLQAGATSGSLTFTLPTADGTSGQVLQTNGSGVLSWKTDATNSPAGSDTQLQFNNSGSFGADSTLTFNSTSKLLSAQRFGLSGNISSAAWTTSGIRYANVAGTITDTSSSGTVATAYTNVYGGNTIAASNSTTFTNYFNTFIAAPVSGTNVTFTNAWALGLGGAAQIAAGTYTANQSALDITQTWNNSGVTFTGLKYNVTNTASNVASLLLDLQVGGTSQFKVDRGGTAVVLNNYILTNAAGGISNGGGVISSASFDLNYNYLGFVQKSGNFVGWSPNSANVAAIDLYLTRRGTANLRLGAADAAAPVAQTLSVQSVVASGSTNTAGVDFTITGSQSTGSGVGGSIVFQTSLSSAAAGSQNSLAERLRITGAGLLTFAGTTSSFPALKRSSTTLQVRLADDSADAPINALSGTFTDNTANTSAISSTGYSLTGSSSVSMVDLAGTWNTTGTPSAIKLNITNTASNAASNLIDLGTGGGSYVSQFKVGVTGNVAATGSILSSSATGGTGYATGAGGAVTQATDRTTGVTLNKICGQITLVSAAGTATWQTFTVTNSTVAATDTIRVVQASGTDLYQIFITNVSAGSFKITYATTGGTTNEQPVFNFSVIKAVAA